MRSLRASNTTLKTSEIELRLSNEGLQSEVARWRAQFGAELPRQQGDLAPAPEAAAPSQGSGDNSFSSMSGANAAVGHVVQAFKTMPHAEQQECLKALHKHAADSLPI